MGYLADQNNEIIVDAILTSYGRQKLASGQQLGIVKFALSDDEIDYTLYNANHPMGSDFFDIAIRKMPVLEPVPEQDFRYTLFTSADSSVLSTLITVAERTKSLNSYTIYPIVPSLQTTPADRSKLYYSLTIPSNYDSTWFTVRATSLNFPGFAPPQELLSITSTGGNPIITGRSLVCYGTAFEIVVGNLAGKTTSATFAAVINVLGGTVQAPSVPIALTLVPSVGNPTGRETVVS